MTLALTGCAASATPAATTPAAEPTAPAPTVIDNCGTPVPVADPPERVLAIKSTSIEMLLALGLQDRIIATAYQDGPFAAAWADRGAGLDLIAEKVPSAEATLALDPDFIYAGWESILTTEGVGDRAALADLGIRTYVSPAACREPAYKPARLSFDDVYDEIAEVGTIFDASAAAADVVDGMRSRLDELTPDTRGLSALWYSSGSDTPYIGAGSGAPQMIMDAVGLTNIAADVDDSWTSMSWEAVVDRDPDVIVLVDSTWNTADHKKEVLRANPATAQLRAVQEDRYLVVPFAATEAGVRNVEAVDTLLTQLSAIPSS